MDPVQQAVVQLQAQQQAGAAPLLLPAAPGRPGYRVGGIHILLVFQGCEGEPGQAGEVDELIPVPGAGGDELIKSFGLYTGFVLGYIIEDKFIGFSTQESRKKANIFTNNKTKPKLSTKILRFIVGIVTLGIIYAAGKSLQILLFADASQDVLYIIEYIRYTIVVLWGVAGAPFLFEHFGLN